MAEYNGFKVDKKASWGARERIFEGVLCVYKSEIPPAYSSKLSGTVCDKNGNLITDKSVKVFIFDKDTGELVGQTTSNSADGTWECNVSREVNAKVVAVFTLEGDYGGDTDIAGAEFDITQEGS